MEYFVLKEEIISLVIFFVNIQMNFFKYLCTIMPLSSRGNLAVSWKPNTTQKLGIVFLKNASEQPI